MDDIEIIKKLLTETLIYKKNPQYHGDKSYDVWDGNTRIAVITYDDIRKKYDIDSSLEFPDTNTVFTNITDIKNFLNKNYKSAVENRDKKDKEIFDKYVLKIKEFQKQIDNNKLSLSAEEIEDIIFNYLDECKKINSSYKYRAEIFSLFDNALANALNTGVLKNLDGFFNSTEIIRNLKKKGLIK